MRGALIFSSERESERADADRQGKRGALMCARARCSVELVYEYFMSDRMPSIERARGSDFPKSPPRAFH